MKAKHLRKKKIVISLIVFLGLFALSSLVSADEMKFEKLWAKVQKEGVLKVGVAAADPHTIKNPKTGEWTGIAVNVMKKLADVLGVKLQLIDTTWDYIIAGCLANKWDIAAALNERGTRGLAVNFSRPYYFYQISFAYKKDNQKLQGASKFEDFDKKGIKASLMSGTAQDKTLSKVAKNLQIVRYPTLDESRMAILSGRADFLVDDNSTNFLFELANREMMTSYVPDPPLAREGVCFGFRKSVSLEEIQVLDIVIRDLINRGELREWEEEFGMLVIKKME